MVSAGTRAKYSRRNVLRGGAALGATAGLMLAGCGDDDDDGDSGSDQPSPTPRAAQSQESEQAKRGGELRYVGIGSPSNLDLFTQSTAQPLYHVGHVYSGLIGRRLDNSLNLTLEPDLAEKWEQQDASTVVLTLREGVKFHNVAPTNGRALSSDDITFSFERAKTGTPRPRKAQFDLVDKLEFPDARTVKITLKQPVAEFMLWMADPYNVILPREATDDFLKIQAAGTGPFILQEYRSGVGSTAVRNPDYFIKDRPYLDKMKVDDLPDQETMLTAFRARNYDISAASAGGYLRKPHIDQVKSSIPDAQFYRIPNLNIGHIRFNLEKAPFKDVRVRKAVDLVQDDSLWITALAFGDGARSAPVPAGLGKWALPVEQLPKRPDLTQAKALLEQAGISPSNTLEVQNVMLGSPPSASSTQGAAILEELLKPLGLIVKTSFLDTAAWLQALTQKNFDMNLINGVLGFTEPGTYVETYYWDLGGRGYTKHNDTTLNDMIVKQRTTTDEAQRVTQIHDIQKRVIENAYYSHLFSDSITLATQPKVHNFRLDFLHGGNNRYWHELWLDS
jgi:peptide/nickel transport system substrate-binding protein